jgi:arylsulfatase A-like enzyme
MKRILFLLVSLLALPLFAGKPNIIFILTDDLGYGDVGILFQNQREGIQIKTPELDQMAMAGTIMNRHYCPAPICAPSRASLMTGIRAIQMCAICNLTKP